MVTTDTDNGLNGLKGPDTCTTFRAAQGDVAHTPGGMAASQILQTYLEGCRKIEASSGPAVSGMHVGSPRQNSNSSSV